MFIHLTMYNTDISKAFDRVWHQSLLSKLPYFVFYPSLSSFVSSFLSGRFISAVAEVHYSYLKIINSGVSQGSILLPTLLLLFINDLLPIPNYPIHSYADDSTLHFSTSFDLQDLQDSRLEAAERFTSDLALISDWSRRNLVYFNVSKTQFLHLSSRHNLPNSYILFFDNTQLSPLSSILTQESQLETSYPTLTQSTSSKLSVLYRLRQFLYPEQLLSIYRGLVRIICVEVLHACSSPGQRESRTLRLINSSLTDNLFPLRFRRHVASLYFLSLFSL